MRCKFCQEDILSKNFIRHMERHHRSEEEIEQILKQPKNSKARRQAFILLRKDTNFHLHISGTTRPCRQIMEELTKDDDYYPCIHCKGLFKRKYLKRHAKVCRHQGAESKSNRVDHLSTSHTLMACSSDLTDTISKMNVKYQVGFTL